MKKAVVLVEQCWQCPFCHGRKCTKQDKWVDFFDTLDPDCPLEDAEEER